MTSTGTDDSELLEALRKVTVDLHRSRAQLREERQKTREPIAIVGTACRFPGGVRSPRDLWRLLDEQRDVLTEFPEDRGWGAELFDPDPGALGKTYARTGSFLSDLADFDAEFFGITPLEALPMDPQQRLLLEVAWEAMEDAGLDPEQLRGSTTGVFAGFMSASRYGMDASEGEGHRMTGLSASVVSGRIAYALGLEGPAITLDTGCSSSLVAIHVACQALRAGDCELALVGGVTAMATPDLFIEFARQRGLSSDGRCRSFAAAADGTGFGEGAGILVLERLSAARENGHEVRALVRGTAVNQDGASNGLTAPSGTSQVRVINAALRAAGKSAADIDVVEGHGTGTPLGDPIELGALCDTYGQGRAPERPLWLGSIKSNLGHTSAAAGVAGVIKIVESLRAGTAPATLHVDTPTPRIAWPGSGLSLLTEPRPWPRTEGRARCAGVSSFGISGTNSHVIIEEAPARDSRPAPAPRPALLGDGLAAWPLSGRGAANLRAQAAGVAERDWAHARAQDVALALAARPRLRSGAVAVGDGLPAIAGAIRAIAAGEPHAGVVAGEAADHAQVGILLSGQGSQRTGMGAELARHSPVFRASWQQVLAHFDPSVRAVIEGGDQAALDRTAVAQPALFALEVALLDLLAAAGVRPSVLIGHSVGELAAAYAAGAMNLEDACRLVAARGAAMERLPAGGAMLAVALTESDARAAAATGPLISLAAVNGERASVLSGPAPPLARLEAELKQQGIRCSALKVSHAFHSALMEPALEELERAAASVTYTRPAIPVISNVTGRPVDAFDAAYWVTHAREPVRFGQGVEAARRLGATAWVEAGPTGVLSTLAPQTRSVPMLRSGRPEREQALSAIAHLHVSGAEIDWAAVHGDGDPAGAPLPPRAWVRRRFWLGSRTPAPNPAAGAELSGAEPGLAADQPAAEGLIATLSALPAAERVARTRALVCQHIALALGYDGAEAIDPATRFADLGVDSLGAVRLANQLADATGLDFDATLAFDYATPAAVAEFVLSEIGAGTPDGPAQHAESEPVAAARTQRAVDQDAVAIVGMACRFPGGIRTPEDLWRLVDGGHDAMTEFPADRGWDLDRLYHPDPDNLGTTYARLGGFLDGVGDFDAGFFGISPLEAIAMDPQHRHLLEVAWEAVEAAGIDPLTLGGTATSVYTGLFFSAYGVGAGPALEGYRITGATTSVASGRIAYQLGLDGAAVTVDTACSSSLVALHLGLQALRAGECERALVGGVTIMSTPDQFIESSRQRGVAPDGRCKAFGAAADGTGWGEGVGMLVLEPLERARAAGREVLAIVRGSAINQDGASNGLTAPSGPAQERVIEAALRDAGLGPADVDVVEAHGTGTALGDPIEARALMRTYGQRPGAEPLWLGSVKSNFGHTAAAAGVASVIKVVCAMRAGRLPKTLNAEPPNPHVDWSRGEVRLLAQARDWPAHATRPRRAGISSFGMSGTNAHVVLEAPEPAAPRDAREDTLGLAGDGVVAWPVSGRGDHARRRQAEALAARLHDSEEATLALPDGAAALAGRAQLSHRAVVLARTRAELGERLEALGQGRPAEGIVLGEAGPGTVGLLFSGHGGQRVSMGTELARISPVFRAEWDAALSRFDPNVRAAISASADASFINTSLAQQALFALQAGLVALLRAAGVQPAVVLGHSTGELTAAYAAGALGLDDACRLARRRAELIVASAVTGGMLAAELTETEAVGHLGRHPELELAAINASSSTVISGPETALAELAIELKAAGVRCTVLPIKGAGHSRALEPLLPDLARTADTLAPAPPRITLISTLTGTPVQTLDGEHWARHAREPVRFADAVEHGRGLGVTSWVELGPGGVLSAMVPETGAMPMLREGRSEAETVMEALAHLHCGGAAIDWSALNPGGDPRRASLPTYRFARRRFWVDPAPVTAGGGVVQIGADETAAKTIDLSALPAAERPAAIEAIVTDHLRAVLGLAADEELDATLTFVELGLDSLGAARLRTGAGRAIGAAIPPRLVFEHPTLPAFAAAVAELVSGDAASGSQAGPGDRPALDDLRQAAVAGRLPSALAELADQAAAGPCFAAGSAAPAQLLSLITGAAAPALVCVPTFVAGPGPEQYARFAHAAGPGRTLAAFRLPGTSDGEPLPADLDALIASLRAAVSAFPAPALVGYSAGAMLAHALAAALDRAGTPVSALVLIDPPLLSADARQPRGLTDAVAHVVGGLLADERMTADGTMFGDGAEIRAMAHYARLLESWQAPQLQTPTLLLRATRRTTPAPAMGDLAWWPAPDRTLDLDADHISIIQDDSSATARATTAWLGERTGGR